MLPLYLTLAVATSFVDLRMRAHPDHPYASHIPQVISGTAAAPAIYRVLVPYSNHFVSQVSGLAPSTVWLASRFLWLLAAYIIFDCYLRTWLAWPTAAAGTLLVAATLPLTFTNSWGHPDHFPELALFTLACLAAARQNDWLFAASLVLASLNRETSAFLIPVYGLARPMRGEHMRRTLLFAGLWASMFVGIRLWRGFQHYDYFQLARNLEFLRLLPSAYDVYYRSYAYFGVILFGPLLYLALKQVRRKPYFVRRVLWVVPMFVAMAFSISSIIETRIFTPLYPLVMPAVMFTLSGTTNAGGIR